MHARSTKALAQAAEARRKKEAKLRSVALS
jgi:hypothetical protein